MFWKQWAGDPFLHNTLWMNRWLPLVNHQSQQVTPVAVVLYSTQTSVDDKYEKVDHIFCHGLTSFCSPDIRLTANVFSVGLSMKNSAYSH